jgi:hypothetical protein
MSFALRDADGNRYGQECCRGPGVPQLLYGSVESGKTVRDFVIWEVPEAAEIVACDVDTEYGYGEPILIWSDF